MAANPYSLILIALQCAVKLLLNRAWFYLDEEEGLRGLLFRNDALVLSSRPVFRR